MFLQNADIDNRRLAGLKTGEEAIIKYVFGQGAFRKRISEMGFVKGQKVKVIKNAPMKDPVEYEIMGYKVSLRRSEAEMIEVVAVDEAAEIMTSKFAGTIDQNRLKISGGKKSKNISVALVGNPNCGKTTLFNYASGSKERVGNYAGVTIDAKEARFRQNDFNFRISDLPGTYSITEYSPEELYVRNHIAERKPDVVVNVVDASNLERNLYLTTQLIDMNIKVVIALNMYDELEQKSVKFDYKRLGEMIGIPIVPTVASKGKGLKDLFDKIIEVYEERDPIVRHIHINYGSDIEQAITAIQTEIKKDDNRNKNYSTRYLSIKLLEDDANTRELLKNNANYDAITGKADAEITRLEDLLNDKSETLIADAKYGFIAGALKETYKSSPETRRQNSREIDKILTHKIWGFPIFIFFIWATFQLTFTLGSYPMDWIDAGVAWLADTVANLMPDGALKDLLVDGIIGGVGGVIIFLPNT